MTLTRAQNLDLAIDNVAKLLADVTAHPKPDYSLDGESYSWSAYVQMLTSQLEALEKARQRADSSFEVRTIGI